MDRGDILKPIHGEDRSAAFTPQGSFASQAGNQFFYPAHSGVEVFPVHARMIHWTADGKVGR
jgi:hypothetical protein